MISSLTAMERQLRLRSVRLRYAVTSGLYRRAADHRAWLETLRGSLSGRPLLVVGNGPSLLHTPLDELSAVPAIGMNKIDLLFPRTRWRPQYIVCTNSMVVRQHRDAFERSTIPVLLPYKVRRQVDVRRAQSIHFFNAWASADFSRDFAQGVGRSPTVTYTALQLAYFLGANPVVLVGVDHRFKGVSGPANTYVRSDTHDSNHFDPNYFAPGMLWGLPDLEASEIVYRTAREAFEADGREVIDATVDGCLRIFPKVSIDEAVIRLRGSRQK
jgi:hypothetical protein